MIILDKPKRTKYIHALVFGPPASASKFVLTFPSIVSVDANGSLEDFVGSKEDIRVLRTTKATDVNELLDYILSGKERAGSFVLNGLSRIQNEIEFMTNEGFGKYKPAVRHRLCEMTDRVRLLPMHTVMTARTVEDRARVGDIVGGRVVGADERPVVGMTYDVDPEVPYSCNLTLEMIVNERGGYDAKVISSHVTGINMDDVIEDPTFAKLLEMTGMKAESSQRSAPIEAVQTSRVQESKIIVAATPAAPVSNPKNETTFDAPVNETLVSDAPSAVVEPEAIQTDDTASSDKPKIALVGTDMDLIGIGPGHNDYSSNKHFGALVRRLNDLKTALDKDYVRKPTQDYIVEWGYKLDGKSIPPDVRLEVIPKFDAAIVEATAALAGNAVGLKIGPQEATVPEGTPVPSHGSGFDSDFSDEMKSNVVEMPSSKFGIPSHRVENTASETPEEKFGEPSHRVDQVIETVMAKSEVPFDDEDEAPTETIAAATEDNVSDESDGVLEAEAVVAIETEAVTVESAPEAVAAPVKLITKSQTSKIVDRKDSYHVTDEDFAKILSEIAPGIMADDLSEMTHAQANDVLAKLARLKPSEQAA